MNRLLSLLLLGCLLFSSAGCVLLLKLQQYQVRQEVKQRLKAAVPAEELVLLKIARQLEQDGSPAFERIHSREFRYRGQLYDIVRQEAHEDTTWYYCLHDAQETRLFAQLEDLTDQELDRTGTRQKQRILLFKLLSSLYFAESGFSWAPSARVYLSHTPRPALLSGTLAVRPPSPPPQA